MKGPALQYDIRALRHFICDACGRTCDMPGRYTSCQCNCSTPPRWMRPLDRPSVIRPDVSAFISPADPLDHVVDENESDEVIPGWKPPVVVRTSQPPQRRRLSEVLPSESVPASEQDGFGGGLPIEPARPAGGSEERESPAANRPDRRADRPARRNERSGGQRSSEHPPRRRESGPRPAPNRPPRPATESVPDDFGSGVDSAAAPTALPQPSNLLPNTASPSDVTSIDEVQLPEQPPSADRRNTQQNRRRPRRRGRGEGRSDRSGPPNST